jgi:hypothetical protein
MAEKTISGDSIVRSECESRANRLAVRLLTVLLLDSGAIDRDVLIANGATWLDKIRATPGDTEFQREATAVFFSSALTLDDSNSNSPDDPVRIFEVIKGGKT